MRRLLLYTVIVCSYACLAVIFPMTAEAALVVRNDGTSLNCTIAPEQSLTITRNGKTGGLALYKIEWLTGGDVKNIRLKSTPGSVLRCHIKPQSLRVKADVVDETIPIDDVAFLYTGDVDPDVTHIAISEYDGGSTIAMKKGEKEPGKISVHVLAPNWCAGVRLSDPKYPETLSNWDEWTLTFTIETSSDAYANLQKRAGDVMSIVDFRAESEDAHIYVARARNLSSLIDQLPKAAGKPSTLSIPCGDLFRGYTGRGFVEVYIVGLKEDLPKLAGGAVTIEETVSNVFSLPVHVTGWP